MKRPPPPLRLQQTRLANGVVVCTARLSHLASSHVCVRHRGGPIHEDDTTWGMSHLLEHMVFRGTRRHKDARAVSLAADDFGGEIDGATWRDRVVYDTRVDAGREPEAIALLCEMLGAPRFEGLAIEKGVLREELLELVNEDGIETDADNLSAQRLFAGHGLARTIEGTVAHLDATDLKSLRRFHRETVGPDHLVVSVAGPVEHAAVVAATARTFGTWSSGRGPRPGVPPSPPRRA
ncbi:MAG: M16 family metallopeptidase, partial [Myxococcota bacterium]